jgi:hypothetical protein
MAGAGARSKCPFLQAIRPLGQCKQQQLFADAAVQMHSCGIATALAVLDSQYPTGALWHSWLLLFVRLCVQHCVRLLGGE